MADMVVVFSRDGIPAGIYESVKATSLDLGCTEETVKKAINTGELLLGRFLVDYALDDSEIKPIPYVMYKRGLTWNLTLGEAKKILELVNIGAQVLHVEGLKSVKYLKNKYNEVVDKYKGEENDKF